MATAPATPASVQPIITNDELNIYYCWTHGLCFNCNHTSSTCSNLANGHCTDMPLSKTCRPATTPSCPIAIAPLPKSEGGKPVTATAASELVKPFYPIHTSLLSTTATGPPTQPFYAIANSGCTTHFFSSTTLVCNKCLAQELVQIHTPSGAVLQSMHEADLALPGLLLMACHGQHCPSAGNPTLAFHWTTV